MSNNISKRPSEEFNLDAILQNNPKISNEELIQFSKARNRINKREITKGANYNITSPYELIQSDFEEVHHFKTSLFAR